MKKVDQIVFEKGKGDCLRACLATILEFDINEMPNFWERTQNGEKFFNLVDNWLIKHFSLKLLTVRISEEEINSYTENVLCIAVGKSSRGVNHAVVWFDNEIFHDPHPSKSGLVSNIPDYFIFFIPTGLKNEINRRKLKRNS